MAFDFDITQLDGIHGTDITFSDARITSNYIGWDFVNIWKIDPTNPSFPLLRNIDTAQNAGTVE